MLPHYKHVIIINHKRGQFFTHTQVINQFQCLRHYLVTVNGFRLFQEPRVGDLKLTGTATSQHAQASTSNL